MNLRKIRKYLLLGCVATGMFGHAGAQQVVLDWAKQLSGYSQDEYATGNGIALDQNRNVYTAGSFSGSVDFDPGLPTAFMTSAGGIYFNAYVSKVDAQGNFLWAKQLGGVSGTEAYGIALDRLGNVYTTGYFQDTADFDPGPAVYKLETGAFDGSIFISKLDSAGNFVWAKKIGNGSWDAGSSLATDDQGNIYVSGQFDGTVDFDPGTGVTNLTAIGDNDVFIVKLNTDGNFLWAKQLGGLNGTIENRSITIDRLGYIYSTGTFSGTLDFDPDAGTANLTSSGWGSIYISKLTKDGNYVFAKKIGGQYSSVGNAIKVDNHSNIYTAGFFSSTVDFDPGAGVANLTSSGSGIDFDVFVLKLDSLGNYSWARKLGGTSFEDCKGMDIDARGNVYTTGYFSGTADFDPGTASYPLTSIGSDIYISKLDSSGNFVWAKQTGRTLTAENTGLGRGIAVDAGSNIYTTGGFVADMDFDPDAGLAVMHAGAIYSDDAFIHKMMCIDTTSSALNVAIDSCVTYTLNGFTYTHSGTYIQRIPNSVGCDSIITLNLTISNSFTVHISVNNSVLQADAAYAGYQWLLNGSPIAGATGSTYTATQNGNYALVATNALGCTDTSNVLAIGDGTSIDGSKAMANSISIYPNPAHDVVFIKAPVATTVVLTSVEGKQLRQSSGTNTIRIDGLSKGIYFLRILDRSGNLLKVERITKD